MTRPKRRAKSGLGLLAWPDKDLGRKGEGPFGEKKSGIGTFFVLIAEKAASPLPLIPTRRFMPCVDRIVDLSCDRDCGLRVWYVGYRRSVLVL